MVLGAGMPGSSAPRSGASPGSATLSSVVPGIPVPGLPPWLQRLRLHPYVRLSLNGSFSALWAGQLISLLGDRIHQVALLFLVLRITDSPAAVAAVLVVTTLPNLFLGPIAGAFVDRWDAREVMIVSDLLRAALVMAIPIAAATNLLLVFPLVFGVTAISIFFRPARVAVLTRVVDEDDLLAANSALWVGETIADIGGYPLAGLFVAFLGGSLPLAFWIDGATYAASALLIFSIVLQPLPSLVSSMRQTAGAAEAEAHVGVEEIERIPPGDGRAGLAPAGTPASGAPGATGWLDRLAERWAVLAEAREGWRFLRGETVLLANTMQAIVGQVMIGIVLALLPIYARDTVLRGDLSPEAVYSFLEAGIGVGNLVGGFAVGLIGARLGLGRMVIVGYALTGGLVAILALTDNLGLAMVTIFGVGIGNLIFVIPSQTLFQQRTPPELMGRVVGLRFSLTFGAMTLGIAMAGLLGEALGAATVIGLFGLLTFWSGVTGLLVPSIRDA
jgi:DHA3 family macrolide efflux protein-like MFS transporter